MSYASDKGLKVGSKIKILEIDRVSEFFKVGDILTLIEDDLSDTPWFKGGGHDRKPMHLPVTKWEHYKEDGTGVTSATAIKFPCCVPTSEIKDEETFEKVKGLFIKSGANLMEDYFGWGCPNFGWYGVDYNRYTKFWDWKSNYSVSDKGEDVTVYTLKDLFPEVTEVTPSVASQEAITERLEDSPSVGIDYSVMGTTASTDPLITITQEVKYTVVIKGITFTFTQEEIDELAEELLGFTTL